MKDNFTDLFSLSSGEQKGIAVLVLIILILLGVRISVVLHLRGRTTSNDSIWFMSSFDSGSPAEALRRQAQDDFSYAQDSLDAGQDDFTEIFVFDPNTVTAGDLRRLGLNNRLIRTWINYRNKGGRFRITSDIGKLYGMNREIYARLSPYVRIKEPEEIYAGGPVFADNTKIDINRSDSLQLIKVRGIGPVLSGRILKYRGLLGGFYTTDQLLEVYGFPDSVLMQVNRWFYADTAGIRKININEAAEEELRKHPYIGKYLAQGIIRYRTQVLIIRDPEELKINGLLTGEEFEKVKEYLDI